MTNEEIIKLVLQIAGQKDLKESADAADKLKDELGKVGDEAGKAEGKFEKLKLALDTATAGFNKFQEGGVESVIPFISELAGKIPVIGPAFQIVNTAIEYGLPLLKKLSEYLGDSNEKLAPFKTWLDQTAGAMEGFQNRQEAINAALKDYRGELDEGAKAEEEAEKKRGGERFTKGKGKSTTAEARKQQRADIFESLTAGNKAKLFEELTTQFMEDTGDDLIAEIEKEFTATTKEIAEDPEHRYNLPIQRQLAQMQAEAKRKRALAEVLANAAKVPRDLLAAAQTGGEEAIAALAEAAPEGSLTAEIARLASPEEQQAQRQADREAEEQRKAIAARVAQEKLAAKHKANRAQQVIDRAKTAAKIEALHAKEDAAAAKKTAADEAKELAEMIRNAPTAQQIQHEQALAGARSQVAGFGLGTPTPQQLESIASTAERNLAVFPDKHEAMLRAVLAKYREISDATGIINERAEAALAQIQRMRPNNRFGPMTQQRSNQTWGMQP